MKATILIVDDDRSTAEDLRRYLETDFECLLASTGEEAVAVAGGRDIAAALVDLDLGRGIDGFEAIRRLRVIDRRTAVLVVTNDETEEAVRRAGELGVEDFLRKSSGADALKRAIRHALILRRVSRRVEQLEESQAPSTLGLVAESPRMRCAQEEADRAARHTLPLLIEGPVGAGKLLLARYVHERSRQGRPLRVLHCGTLDHTVVDVELFGSEPGAYTEARRRPGAFEETEDGTLVLDDIDCLPLDKQRRLLQPIDQRIIRRMGGHRDLPVRCRIVATTNKDLRQLQARGVFLEDLLSRLQGAPAIRVPGIEERREDLPGLVRLFAREAAENGGWPAVSVPREFIAEVMRRSWPSVRHLSRAVEYSVATSGGMPTPATLPEVPGQRDGSGVNTPGVPGIGGSSASISASVEELPDGLLEGSLREVVDRVRRTLVRRAMAASEGDKRAAATRLGISVQWLNAVLREAGEGPVEEEA